MRSVVELLTPMRETSGSRLTTGLPDETVTRFERADPSLREAARQAREEFRRVAEEFPGLIELDESEQIDRLQQGLLQFYSEDKANPYAALAASGPWVVTLKGAVVYDCGGYGILGLGHNPPAVMEAIRQPQVMANIMTPNTSHLRAVEALTAEIGQRREQGCPFPRFVFLNSGSEAVAFAARVADTNAREVTDPGGPRPGARIRKISLTGAFHGRTDRPARFSHSTASTYEANLASFRDRDDLVTVPVNDVQALGDAFEAADRRGDFLEALFMEPVMGEGNPGMAVRPEFYALARGLTRAHGSLLLVDSIQAGLRTAGYLSVVDYPGFETLDPPDMEAYSKALNAGQYPMSAVALTERAAGIFRRGTYGNTMTANPRALDAASAVLGEMTPELRSNIVAGGRKFVRALEVLAEELDGAIVGVQGTGLLVSCQLARRLSAAGSGSVEDAMRKVGVGVVHGGRNSVRFTPRFGITAAELELVVECLRECVASQWRAVRQRRKLGEPVVGGAAA